MVRQLSRVLIETISVDRAHSVAQKYPDNWQKGEEVAMTDSTAATTISHTTDEDTDTRSSNVSNDLTDGAKKTHGVYATWQETRREAMLA